MGDLDLSDLQRAGIFSELAVLFPTELEAHGLLADLGADRVRDLPRLPAVGTMSFVTYWRRICERIDDGMFEHVSLAKLVAEAAQRFPRNAALAGLAGTAPVRIPGPAGGVGQVELRVLCLQACPEEYDQLQLQHEYRVIADVARRRGSRLLKISANPATRRNDVIDEILRVKPDILHFCGHGLSDGMLVFEEDDGSPGLVEVDALARVLELLPQRLSCLVLGSCFGGLKGHRLLGPAKTIIGSTKALGDDAAVEFTRGFYTTLVADSAVENEPEQVMGRAFRGGLAQMGILGYSTAQMRFEPERIVAPPPADVA